MRGLVRQSDSYITADRPEKEAAVIPTDAELEMLGLNKSGRSIETGMLNPRGE